jgi:hypothetical protein
LYFTGESFRNVQKFLKLQGVKVTHVAILSIERRQWYYCGGGNGAHSISSHGIGGNRANATTIPKSEMFFN